MTRPILRPQAEVDLVERSRYDRDEGDFPCGWFYFASGDHIDVVRLLADAQDIAVVLADIDQE